MLLFSSDYPHWHFDGDEALPAELPDATVAPCSPATRSAPIPGSEARHGRAPRGAPRRPPGSDLELMRRQYLDARNVEYGILAPLFPTGRGDGNPEFAAAIRAAVNDWQRDRWTRPEPRLKASIVIPYQDPPAAVAEIERCAGDPDFAQVLMLARTSEPLGSQRYWPIFIKAVEVGLPVGVHVFGYGGHPVTGPAGRPTTSRR